MQTMQLELTERWTGERLVALAAAILAGLGARLLDHQAARQTLSPRNVRFAFVRTFASLGLPLRRALDVVTENKLSIVLTWLRVSRRPLPYAALEPHVVIRCFCA